LIHEHYVFLEFLLFLEKNHSKKNRQIKNVKLNVVLNYFDASVIEITDFKHFLYSNLKFTQYGLINGEPSIFSLPIFFVSLIVGVAKELVVL